jgi:hypothetical protein
MDLVEQYPYVLVRIADGHVVSGWEYREDAKDHARECREDGIQGLKVLTRKGYRQSAKARGWFTERCPTCKA